MWKRIKTFTRRTLDNAIGPIISKYSIGHVLDIGALHSPYRHYVKCTRYSVLDIKTYEGVDYLVDIHNAGIKSNTFDTIIATEVLEHLYNPFKAVDEIYRILKPNGYLIATTRFIYPYHGEPDDYFRFTEFGLKKLFSNFDHVKIIKLGNLKMVIFDLLLLSINSRFLNILYMLVSVLISTKSSRKETKTPLGFGIIAQKHLNKEKTTKMNQK